MKNRLDEIWGVECTLYYPEKYAGTADCVGVYEGKETIIDFKQSNKPKKAVEGFGIAYVEAAQYGVPSIGGKDGDKKIVFNSRVT